MATRSSFHGHPLPRLDDANHFGSSAPVNLAERIRARTIEISASAAAVGEAEKAASSGRTARAPAGKPVRGIKLGSPESSAEVLDYRAMTSKVCVIVSVADQIAG
jgi:hypothetical protein